jgi:hypothetical protein
MRLGDEESGESPQISTRQPGAHEDAPRAVLALVDRSPELVELCELCTILVRDEEMDRLVPVGEPLGDPRPERVEPGPGQGRHLNRFREAVGETSSPKGVHSVDLVDHDFEREPARADLIQDARDGCRLLVELLVGHGRVDDVEDEVGDEGLLERRGEALHQLCGKAPDESDGVRHQIGATLVVEGARRGVERLEQPVVDCDARVRQGVEERGLADVRIAGERDGRRLGSSPLLPSNFALLAQVTQAPTQEGDPPAGDAAVALEL